MADMEDVQPAPETLEPTPALGAAPDNDVMAIDVPELPQEESHAMETEEPTITLPKIKVEVVIEKKELEPEDPIFPDHYYDNGQIPVFKPVKSPHHRWKKTTENVLIPDDGAVPRL